MRKVFLALMVIAAIALTGCKNPKDEPTPTPPSVDSVYVYLKFNVEALPLVGHEAIAKDIRHEIIWKDIYNAVEKTIWTEQKWLATDTMLVLDKAVKKIEGIAAKRSGGLFNGKISFNIQRRNKHPMSVYLYREFTITPADEVYEYNYEKFNGKGAKDFKAAVNKWIYTFDQGNPKQSLKDTATIFEAMDTLVAEYRHEQLDGTFVIEMKSKENGVLWHKEWNEVSHPSYNVGYITTTKIMPGFEQVWASVIKDYEYLRENTEPSDNSDSITAIIANWVEEKNLDKKFAFAHFEQIVSYDNWEQAHRSSYGDVTVHIGEDAKGIDTGHVKGEDKDALISALQRAMVDWEKEGLCYGQLDKFTATIKDVCRKYPKTEGTVYIKALRSNTAISMETVASILLPVE